MKRVRGGVVRLVWVVFLAAMAITVPAASAQNSTASNDKFSWSDTEPSPDQRADPRHEGVDLSIFNVAQNKWILLPGEYGVAIGGASDDVPMKAQSKAGRMTVAKPQRALRGNCR